MPMKRIESKDNEQIKKVAKLAQKKYRDEFCFFTVENFKTFKDASTVIPEQIFLTQEFFDQHRQNFSSEELDKTTIIFPEIMSKISNLETNVGFLAVYKKNISEIKKELPIIYLNGINDPGNLGTIFRSAVAFGFKNFVLDEKCADIFGPKTVQSAKDAIFKLNFDFDKNQQRLKEIKKEKTVIIGAEISSQSINLNNFSWPPNFCLILGNESSGLEVEVKKFLDQSIRIEIQTEMESLNVGVSAGILFYQIKKAQK